MIFSLNAETTCPECDIPIEFEVTEDCGDVDVKCDACGHTHTITYQVTVDII
jgi:uncharacterized Zn finger protein